MICKRKNGTFYVAGWKLFYPDCRQKRLTSCQSGAGGFLPAITCCIQSICEDNVIEELFPPVTDFTYSSPTGMVPLTVNFTDISTNEPTGWQWDLDGDGTFDSFVQNPSFTYTTPGTYSVKLVAINQFGEDTMVKTALVVASAPLSLPNNYFPVIF